MAKSKKQFIDSIIQEVTKLQMTDDNAFIAAREWLGDKLDGYRATVIRSYANEKRVLDACYQVINCLSPECLGVTCEIGGLDFTSNAELWQVKIPELLNINGAIKYFGPFTLQSNYTKVDLMALTTNQSRWGRKDRKFARIGNVLYYHDLEETLRFTLVGITANPSDVCGFNDIDPYPLPKELEQQLELLVKKDLYPMLNIPIDFLNDAMDNQAQIKQQDGAK